MNNTGLIATIQKAFDGVPRSDTSLKQFWLIDQYGMSRKITDQEWKNAGLQRSDLKWQDIPDAEIRECGSLLAHMQAADFQYFLPAYMLYSLRELERNPDRADTVGSVVFHLYPSKKSPSSRAYALSQLSLLTDSQRKAAVEYLRFVAAYGDDFDRPNASKAIKRFWSEDIVERGFSTSIVQMP